MSYNGSGTFLINTSGQPVVTGTSISSSVFNALTADLATGLSTAITKDGQTATTARIPFAQGISSTLVTDSTSTTTGSIITAGGAGVAKALFVGTTANVAGAVTLQSTLGVTGITTFSAQPIFSSLTASSAVATDASKGLVSVTNTGTGNNVLATSPTLTGTIAGASLSLSSLTSGRVPYATTAGLLTDSANLLYSGTDLGVYGLTVGRGAGAVSTNTAFGASALAANTTGSNQTAVGYQAGFTNTTGGNFSAFGGQAGYTYNSTTENWGSVFVGFRSGQFTTSGNDNVFVGGFSGRNNTTGSYNVSLGASSLYSNTTASYNTAVGYQASYTGTTGERNTNLGYQAGYTPTSASESTFVGYKAGYAKTTGDACTFIGNIAGTAATTGVGNTFVGSNSGSSVTTGSKNTILGAYNGNQGGLDIRTLSNYIVLSDGDGNPRMYFSNTGEPLIPRLTSSTTANAANVFVSSTTGELVRSTSSLKYKRDVQDATHGLAEVLQLRPVTYKGKAANDGDTVFGGLIAEEVHEAGLTEFVQYAADGSPDALAYGNMVSVLVKAIQEQQSLITTLTSRITALEQA